MCDVVGEWPSADEHVVTGGPVVDLATEDEDEGREDRGPRTPARESSAGTPGGCGTHVANRDETARRSEGDGWYQPPEMWYQGGDSDE